MNESEGQAVTQAGGGGTETPPRTYIDPSVVTGPQVYSYVLNPNTCEVSEASERVAKEMVRQQPILRELPQNSRIFVRRAARAMTLQGITQFIDLGSGLPTDNNTHEVAQAIEPQTRVVYVDNDPMAEFQAKAMLEEAGAHDVNFIIADIAEPETIRDHPDTRQLIDFTKPIGLMMASVIHLISEDYSHEKAGVGTHELVRQYVDILPSGSLVAFEHFNHEGQDPEVLETIVNAPFKIGITFRTQDEIRRYFDGLELLTPYADGSQTTAPDIVWSNRWRAPRPERCDPSGSWIWAGVARKP